MFTLTAVDLRQIYGSCFKSERTPAGQDLTHVVGLTDFFIDTLEACESME